MANRFHCQQKRLRSYALFVGTKLVGIIEAKAEHKDIPSVIDYQGKNYPKISVKKMLNIRLVHGESLRFRLLLQQTADHIWSSSKQNPVSGF